MLRIDTIIREQFVTYFSWAFDIEFSREFLSSLYWVPVVFFAFCGNEVELVLFVFKIKINTKLTRNSNVPKFVLFETCTKYL